MTVSKYIINQDVWTGLTEEQAKLPHALLFAGPPGVGKRELADALASRLLCESRRKAHQPACGSCASCLMMAGGQHPDFRLLQPDADAEGEEEGGDEGEKKKASKQIRIGQVREIEEWFHVGGHRDGARVCIIDPAESMNSITANSLLKILEEPSASFYFIMITNRWRRLLPTILSRTRRIMFGRPTDEQAIRWLNDQKLGEHASWLPFFCHAPMEIAEAAKSGRMKALETLIADLLKPQDALVLAGRWESLVKSDSALGMEELVTTMQKWLFDLGLCAVGAVPRYFPSHKKEIALLARTISLPALLEAEKQLTRMRRLASHPLNPRLFLEDLCLRTFRPFSS